MSDLDLLVGGRLADPHSVLGAHPQDGGVVVRAFRPAAERVTVKRAGAAAVDAAQVHPDGIFEATITGADLPLDYELEVAYPDGNVFTLRDPYAYLPTLSELDVHLASEGRHEELYDKLGAQVREIDATAGTSFAVWAPAAAAVAVVGDWNSWDGRLHPMRALGSSGIWELFVPGVADGEPYKFEIRTAGRRAAAEGRPLRAGRAAAARDLFRRAPLPARLERRRVDGRTRRPRPARPADVHLRGPPRLVAARSRRR